MVKLGMNWITHCRAVWVCHSHYEKMILVIVHFKSHQFSCKREILRDQHCELLLCGPYLRAQM